MERRCAGSAELSGELADVMLYLIQLASISGIDLGQAVMDKLAVNYGRTWDQEPDDAQLSDSDWDNLEQLERAAA